MGDPGLLIFDGDCGFCTSSAHWIEARWPAGAARTVPWQRLDANVQGDLGLSTSELNAQAWWVDQRGVRGGERAVAAALMVSGGFWGVIGRLIDVPPLRWLARPGYRLVARYRYKLPGATPACRLGV